MQQAQATGSAGGAGGDDGIKARADYEAALKERDDKIAELEGEIAEAAKTAESAERLRAEMDEPRRQDEEQRMGFELQMAGAWNVKAAKALLTDYEGDVDKLKAGCSASVPPSPRRRARRGCRTRGRPRTRACR